MSRTISVDIVLAMIEQAKTDFSVEATSRMPSNDHAAYYNHGVIRGMDTVKANILNKIKDEDEQRKPEAGGPTRRSAY